MSAENCDRDCQSCGENCPSRQGGAPVDMREKPHELSHVKKVIAVASGKGGVGKSLVTGMMAVMMARRGYKTAILDGDITGPSIPRLFGVSDRAYSDGEVIIPGKSKLGIEMISTNMLLDDETKPVVWRGPVIAGMIKQFWSDVIWKDIDFLFVDMPPGTGDVPLTVFQSLPVDSLLVVSTPQQLVSMIVSKAVAMANAMDVPVAGIVENMSYMTCPDCGKKMPLFGGSAGQNAVASRFDVPLLAQLPMSPDVSHLCDTGQIELVQLPMLDAACDKVEALLKDQ